MARKRRQSKRNQLPFSKANTPAGKLSSARISSVVCRQGVHASFYFCTCVCVYVCGCMVECVFPLYRWLLSAQCLMQLVSCACRWLKQSINIGLQLPQFISKEQWQRRNGPYSMFISWCTVWAFRSRKRFGLVERSPCVCGQVYKGKCMSVRFSVQVYVLAWQQIAWGEWAIRKNFQLVSPDWRWSGCKRRKKTAAGLLLIVQ